MKNQLIMSVAGIMLAACGGLKSNDAAESFVLEYDSLQEAEVKLKEYYENEYYNLVHNTEIDSVPNPLMDVLLNDKSTFDYDFSLMKEAGLLDYVESDDKKLRLYYWNNLTGGTMVSWDNVSQIKDGYDIYCSSENIFYDPYEDGENNNGCPYSQIFTVYANDSVKYYLVEALSLFHISNYDLNLWTVEIENGKMKSVNIFDGDNRLKISYNSESAQTSRYDAQTQILYVPEIDDNGKLTGQMKSYKFDGKQFKRCVMP